MREEYEDVHKELIQLFKETTVERTGRDEIIEYTLEAIMIGNGTSYIVKPAFERGTHGRNSTNSVLRPVLMVKGPAIKQDETIGDISTLNIAPTLYDLLDIEVPPFVEDNSRRELWRE